MFVFLPDMEGLTADTLRRCRGLGVYVVAAGENDRGLPFGLRIYDDGDGGMTVHCDGRSFTFTPAIVAAARVPALGTGDFSGLPALEGG